MATGCQTCSRGRFHEMHHLGQGTLGLNHELASKHNSFVVSFATQYQTRVSNDCTGVLAATKSVSSLPGRPASNRSEVRCSH